MVKVTMLAPESSRPLRRTGVALSVAELLRISVFF